MSTSLKSPDGLKDAECKKGQLSHWLPIPYIPVVDIVTPKEEPQIFKIKLPDASHLRGLPKKCRMLAKAVARWLEALKKR
jgi:hypothetical protein